MPAHETAEARQQFGHRSYVTALALLTVVFTLVLLTWASLTPAYRSYDETKHVNSAVRLAYGGGWPDPGDALVAPFIRTATYEGARWTNRPGSDTPFDRDFVDVTPTRDEARSRVGPHNALPTTDSALVDQMTQHPPLYYATEAGLMSLVGQEDGRWDVQLLVLRLVSVGMVAPLPLFVAATTRRLAGSRALALLAAALALAIPQLAYIGGSVNNDNLLVLTGAVATYLLVRIVQGDLRYRTLLLAALVVGAGLMTKAFMAFFGPAFVLAVLLARGDVRLAGRLGRGAVLGAGTMATGGWWWVRNYLLYGSFQQPSVYRQPAVGGDRATVPEFLGVAIDRLAHSFWGDLVGTPELFSDVAVVLLTAALVLLLLAGLLPRRARPASWLLVGTTVLVLVMVLVRGYGNHLRYDLFPGLQGRYLFVSVAGLLAVAAVGVGVLLRTERARAHATLLAAGAGLGLAAYGLGYALTMYYVEGTGVEALTEGVRRWVAWSPLTGWQAGLLLVALVGASLTLLVALARATWRAPRGPGDGRAAVMTGESAAPARHVSPRRTAQAGTLTESPSPRTGRTRRNP